MALIPVHLGAKATPAQAAAPRPHAGPSKDQVELLAPAGSFDALRAAVENGADAIYLAGEHFGARKFAQNFNEEELRRGIDYAHIRGVKIFVVVNTLVFNDEFDAVVDFLRIIRDAGADAVIVQDLGVMAACRTLVPDLPVHISTQATVHNAKGVDFLRDLGAERVILAREMTLKDINEMKVETDAELETFVHGALCYCYSGQCLMSSVIGGRSGNRGACAYTCRLPYTLEGAEADGKSPPPPHLSDEETYAALDHVHAKHVLSSKDLNQLEAIPQLIQAGVSSFKIEGRMKRPEYVAVVVDAYRKGIDRHYAGKFYISDAEKSRVRRIFNREFTPGYLEGKEKWGFTNWEQSGNRGTALGEVEDSGRDWVRVKLNDTLRVKDGIEIVHSQEHCARHGQHRQCAPEEYGFSVNRITQHGRYVTEAHAGDVVELHGRQWSSPNDLVFKTSDVETLEWARATYERSFKRRLRIRLQARVAVGEPITVTLFDDTRGVSATYTSEFIAQPAKKAPLTEARIREQLMKFTDTPYDVVSSPITLVGAAFAPLSELNEARRQAINALEATIAGAYHRAPDAEFASRVEAFTARAEREKVVTAPKVAVNAWTIDNLKAGIRGGAKILYFSGVRVGGLQPKWDVEAIDEALALAGEAEAELWLASGMIQKDYEIAFLREAVLRAKGHPAFRGVLAGNHGAFQVAREETVPVIADWMMNVYNSVTMDWMRDHGAERITTSPEITLESISDVARHSEVPVEAIVHGRLTLMTSEYCTIGHATKCQMPNGTWAPCHDAKYRLTDRTGASFPLETDGACRMYILNSVELAMVNRIPDLMAAGIDVMRIETIGSHPDAVEVQTRAYREAAEAWSRGSDSYEFDQSWWAAIKAVCADGFTTGHYYRGPD